MKLYLLILSFVLFYGCIEEVDINLPEAEKKIVVNGYLNPEHHIKLYLYFTKPYISKELSYQPVENAEIKIFQNDTLLCKLSYNDTTPDKLDFPIYEAQKKYPQVGKKYKLQIKVPGYDIISAETMIPDKPVIDSVEHNLITRNYSKLIHCKVHFKDDPLKKNYYHFRTKSERGSNGFYSDDPLFEGEYYLFDIPYLIFNDQLINGKSYGLDIELFRPQIDSIKLSLSSLTEDAYLYLASINKQKNKDDFPIEGVDINIPISEHVQIYSNINNGLGIFAGMNGSSRTVKFNY